MSNKMKQHKWYPAPAMPGYRCKVCSIGSSKAHSTANCTGKPVKGALGYKETTTK